MVVIFKKYINVVVIYTTNLYIQTKLNNKKGVLRMRDEDFANEEDAYDDEYSEEEIDELEPEMQGFMAGWKRAGKYNKKEEHLNDDFDERH